MNIAFSTKEETTLNTGLKENAFCKTRLSMHLGNEGMIAEADAKELFCGKGNFTFSPWIFSGTKIDNKTENVFFTGSGFDSTTLFEILNSENQTLKMQSTFAVISCITDALQKNIPLVASGAGGILESFTKDSKVKILFLPPILFEQSILNAAKKDYAENQGQWLNKNLDSFASLIFLRSVIAYKALSNKMPFTKEDTSDIQTDILDKNYSRLVDEVNGISIPLSNAVSDGIEFNLSEKETSQNEKDFPLDVLKTEIGLQDNGEVLDVVRTTKISDSEFKTENEKRRKTQIRKIERKRIIRRNTTIILGSLLLLAFISNFSFLRYRDSLKSPTSVSLTSVQTMQAFYTGMHNQDISLMQKMAKGKNPNRYTDIVSHMYVTTKTRAAYELSTGTLTPELWLYRHDLKTYWQFGITNLLIDGKTASYDFTSPKKGDKNLALKIEDEKPILSGDTKNHAISYYMVFSQGLDAPITIEKYSGTLTLTYKKDRWLITKIDLENISLSEDMSNFESDYTSALEQSLSNPVDAVKLLRAKYPWLPDEITMQKIESEVKEKSK